MINGFNGKMLEYIGQVTVTPGKTAALDFFADRVIKDIHFKVRGRGNLTYSAGTPVIREYGMADGLIKRISIQRKGGDDLRTYLGTRQIVNDQLWYFGERGAVLSKGNAASLGLAASSNRVVVPASTQDFAFYEGYVISMENKKSLEYWRTYFSTLGNKSAKIIFDFGQWMDCLDPEDTSTSTLFTGDAVIDVYISKADHLLGSSDSFVDMKHSYDQIVLPGAANRSRYTISPEGELQGFWITGVKGVKEAKFTHEEMLNTFFEIKFDGETIINGNLLDLASINMNNAPIIDLLRGSAYCPLLNNKTWGTGLWTGEGSNTKSIEVFITCNVTQAKFYFEYDRVNRPRVAEVAKA